MAEAPNMQYPMYSFLAMLLNLSDRFGFLSIALKGILPEKAKKPTNRIPTNMC